MNEKNPLRSIQLALLVSVALGAAALPAPAGAQPWIGLTDEGAELLGEEGLGHNGPGAADYFGWALASGDFDGDGVDDVAAGLPGNDCDYVVWDCGSVQVRFGSRGYGMYRRLVLSPLLNGQEPARAFDQYGYALAAGDFNADGRDDLAVGIPGNDALGSAGVDGAVQIHYGVFNGIELIAGEYLAQGVNGVPQEMPSSGSSGEERFGEALAVGDFNGDGHDDLAVGAPFALLGGSSIRSGNVVVAQGEPGGLVSPFLLRQGLDGLLDQPESNDEFGAALASGDFDGDGYDDLAIGVPGEDGFGAVMVVYGSPWSLDFANSWCMNHLTLFALPQEGSRFGESLAVGDFDGDGYDDLAVGAPPYDGIYDESDVGLVSVVYGSADGLARPRARSFYESELFAGVSETSDRFGSSLAAGDFDGDGADDLAIGAEGEAFQAIFTNFLQVGAVTIAMGRSEHGLGSVARQLRPTGGVDLAGLIPDYRWGEPAYGASLAAGDFDGNGTDDLTIGAPVRDVYTPASQVDAGAMAVLYSVSLDPELPGGPGPVGSP